MKTPIFKGSGTAIVTPFTKDGVDYKKFEELIELQIKNNTDALIVCGTTGEASTMLEDEHNAVVKFAVDTVNKRIPVIAGTGSNNTQEAIDLSVHAEKAGADGLLIVSPYYNKTTQKGLYQHTKTIAEAVSLPIVLYNIPGRTGGLRFELDTIKRLAEIPNINAVKEATGDLAFVSLIASECDIILYSGNDDIILPVMSVGGLGVISVISNIMPREIHELCHNYLSGNISDSREQFLKLQKLIKALFIEVNPIPIKTAMNLMGMNAGYLRMPLCEMEEANLNKLKAILKEYQLI